MQGYNQIIFLFYFFEVVIILALLLVLLLGEQGNNFCNIFITIFSIVSSEVTISRWVVAQASSGL